MRLKMTCIALAAAFALPAYAQMSDTPTPGAPRGAQSPSNAPAPKIDRGNPPSDAAAAKSTHGSMDTNRDGFVSRDEARSSAELNRRFSELDKDGDGKLSAQELSGAGSAPANTGSSAPGARPDANPGAMGSSRPGSPTPGAGTK